MKVFVFFAVVAALACASGNPHFVGKITAELDGVNVSVCWKEAGLGNNQSVDYIVTANGTATYVCVNKGGQCPDASNKITVSGPVTAAGTFSSGQNGQIAQCLALQPPGAGRFTCSGGQTMKLAEVSYTAIQIEDTTNGVIGVATPSELAVTAFVCP